MRVLIVLAFVSVAFALRKVGKDKNAVYCKQMSHLDCSVIIGQEEVCDQNGKQYSNMCEFRQAWCLDRDLDTEECPAGSGEEPLSGFERKCMKLMKYDCSKFRAKVMCDSDGNTYRNQCAFKQASCKNKGMKEGKCPSKMCRAAKQQDCSKAKLTKPVCDGEGNVYTNRCEFRKAKCLDGDIKERRCRKEGSGEESGDGEKELMYDEKDSSRSDKWRCRAVSLLDCNLFDKEEVCDQKNRPYGNKCHFLKAQCKDGKLESQKCEEGSGEGSGDEDKEGDKFKAACAKLAKTRCSWYPAVVCGSDGKNYRNECTFKKANCADPSLKMASRSWCY